MRFGDSRKRRRAVIDLRGYHISRVLDAGVGDSRRDNLGRRPWLPQVHYLLLQYWQVFVITNEQNIGCGMAQQKMQCPETISEMSTCFTVI